MMIKLKDSRETIGAPPFCKNAGSRLLPNAPNIPNYGLVLKVARYRVSRALEASLHHDVAHLQHPTNVPTKYQLPTLYGFRDIAWTKFQTSRSLWQDQRSNQGHTMTLHTYNPNQCPYQISTSYTLRFLRYSPDKL